MVENDEYNIALYLSGDEAGLHALIRAYTKRIYGFVFKMVKTTADAEDITQETFVKVWKSIKKYKQGQGFKAWIFTIAYNTSIDYLRKKKEYVFSDFEREDHTNTFIEQTPDTEPRPDELFDQTQDAQQLSLLLDKLSPNIKEIMILHHNEELTFDEIGKIMNKPLNTVKSQYRRGLIELRTYIQEDRLH